MSSSLNGLRLSTPSEPVNDIQKKAFIDMSDTPSIWTLLKCCRHPHLKQIPSGKCKPFLHNPDSPLCTTDAQGPFVHFPPTGDHCCPTHGSCGALHLSAFGAFLNTVLRAESRFCLGYPEIHFYLSSVKVSIQGGQKKASNTIVMNDEQEEWPCNPLCHLFRTSHLVLCHFSLLFFVVMQILKGCRRVNIGSRPG